MVIKTTKTKKKMTPEEKKLYRKQELERINPYKLNIFNIWKKFPKKIMWMFVSAFLYNIAIAVFLSKAATIASGTSSFAQLITFLAPSTSAYYGLFYVAVNVPLMIGFYWKNPRLFMILTYYWMFFQVIIQLIFADYNGNNPIPRLISEYISIYKPNGKGSWWDPFGTDIRIPGNENAKGAVWDGNTWPVLVYVAIGGLLEGLGSAIAWKQRGCIGGTSVISNYIAYKYKKPVGNMFLLIALFFSGFSTIVIGSLEAAGQIAKREWRGEQFLVRMFGTFVYLIIFTLIVNKMFPKYKKVKIEIFSNKTEWVCEHFKKIGYIHAFNIFYGISGYKHNELAKIETIALYLEKDLIFEEIAKVDPNAWICTSNIHDLNGHFDTSYID
ncbi:YitT family protein [Metamycoplasma hyosynoviae]|uniref:YitT family protein n=1 Tax=Metamycoplasma hyosynoviae TaxID=29559 RepID=UPI0023591A20|nr:YitT family protein [Metamycoplasma hyosynoviae]MDC8917116.1 YitT family protein [Metamycoplasma hyosynoviae]MDC8937223.1 YitT family protein [Metamycoplasma hyosynoviae]